MIGSSSKVCKIQAVIFAKQNSTKHRIFVSVLLIVEKDIPLIHSQKCQFSFQGSSFLIERLGLTRREFKMIGDPTNKMFLTTLLKENREFLCSTLSSRQSSLSKLTAAVLLRDLKFLRVQNKLS